MAADQGIIDSVSNTNTKTFGDGPAFYAQLAMSNAVSHQGRINVIAEAAVSSAVKKLLTITPDEAQADSTVSEGGLPSLITSLVSALASAQVSTKVAQTTPPVFVDPVNKAA